MALETLIKQVEKDFPPMQFQWTLTRNYTGKYFANIFPADLRDAGRGPDNHAYSTSPQTALRTAYRNAKRNGVGRHCFGKAA